MKCETEKKKQRDSFELYILDRVNKRNQHYNQYFSAGDIGILYLHIGHHGIWECTWIDWDDINTKALVDYLVKGV